jgi:2'-5' RNA ligase
VRLFVAVVPPDDVLDAVAALDRPPHAGVRWTTRDQWHVTLRFLGDVPDPAPVAAALDSAPLPPATGPAPTATVGPEVTTLGRQVLCLPVAGLDDLAATVIAATAGHGRPPEDRPFRAHLTLARARRASLRPLAGAPLAARFPVAAIRLVRSHLGGRAGPRYEDVHTRPLT